MKEFIPNADWDVKVPWYDKFVADQKEILYLRNLIASKENLKDKARIWLSTIHAIKGGEEDNVILSLHQGRTVQQESNQALTNKMKSIECGMLELREQEIIYTN